MVDCISERYSLPRDRAVPELEDILELCGHPSTREELAQALDEWEAVNKKRALLTWEERKKEMEDLRASFDAPNEQKVRTQEQP